MMEKFLFVFLVSIPLSFYSGWMLMLGLGNLGVNMSYGDAFWTAVTIGAFIGVETALGRTIKGPD